MLQNILLVANILVCCALIGVVLMQRSEGGALGMGGGPSGFMTARGAGDLLTRTTWILFVVFLILSVSLTMLGGGARSVTEGAHIQAIDPSKLNQPPAATAPATPTPGAPATSPLTAPAPGLPGAGPAATPPPSPTGTFRGFPTAQEQMQAAQQQQQQMLQQQAAQRAAAMQAAQQQAAAQAATPHPVQVPAPVVVPPLAPAPSDSTPAPTAPATNP